VKDGTPRPAEVGRAVIVGANALVRIAARLEEGVRLEALVEALVETPEGQRALARALKEARAVQGLKNLTRHLGRLAGESD
jgi:carbonic anhydrase/acetyltransferase-like protein (isoleucine patch superfamily)